MTLQNQVNDYCKMRKVKKKDLAKKIGITPVQLSHWLGGRIVFNEYLLEKIRIVIDADD